MVRQYISRTFVAGVLAAVPLAVTAFVLWYVESNTRSLFGVRVPFLGVAIAIVAIFALGVVVRSLLGRILLRGVDAALSRLPLLREIYKAWKQIALSPEQGMFAKVVLIPDAAGRHTMGFTSAQSVEAAGEDCCCVFVPAAPNPTSGRLYFVRRADCQFLDVSTEDAFKMILSGGNYVPLPSPTATPVE